MVPPAADSTVCCHGPSVAFCTCTCTAPARLAVPDTLTRSDVAPAMLMSASSRPVALCTRLPVSAVVWITPAPPGDNVPALVSVLPAPRLTVAPALKSPPAMLLKALVPVPRITLPITVPKLLTVLLPVSPWIARPDSAVTVPMLVSVLLVPPEIKTPAPLPEPPDTVPDLMVTAIGPPVLCGQDPERVAARGGDIAGRGHRDGGRQSCGYNPVASLPAAAMLPVEVTVMALPPARLQSRMRCCPRW